jgi:DNA polymerase-3 subunit gamma/tau
MVGQEEIIRTLRNGLTGGKLAHAYLFTGPRGTGKTSTARLLAKTINCLNPQDGEPCNECQQCREITAGNSFNVIEIDAASNRGIDSIRELREKVMMPPSTGKYKVYILDEAHMLTVEAFNALLKTLEEPPPHAIFVMATTDVHKMLPTVLSRCQRFDFKRFTLRQIVQHLNFVAKEEHVTLQTGAAELIARAAAGGMRDALSLLDQAIAYAGQEIALSQVQAMLGVADPRAIQKFIAHIAHLDSSAGLHLIHEMVESGADLRQMNSQIAEYWRAMMLTRAGANIAEILDTTDDEIREIAEVAKLFSLDVLIECARVFAQNDLVQKNQGTPQLGLELAFLTCVEAHRRGQTGQPLIAANAVDAATPASSRAAAPAVQSRPAAPSAPLRTQPAIHLDAYATSAPAPSEKSPSPEVSQIPAETSSRSYITASPGDTEDLTTSVSKDNANVHGYGPLLADPVAAIAPQSVGGEPSLTVPQVKEKWEFVKRRIKTRKDGHRIAAFLNNYTIVGVEGNAEIPVVVIRAGGAIHYKQLQKPECQETIEWAMKVELGQECRVRMLPPDQSVPLTAVPPPTSYNESGPSTNTRMAVAPQQSAHLERPAPPVQPPRAMSPRQGPAPEPSADVSTVAPKQENVSEKPELSASPSLMNGNEHTPPLARMNIVRENNSTVSTRNGKAGISGETRQVSVEKKAKSDPVVQEVMRMFKADIKEIHLK